MYLIGLLCGGKFGLIWGGVECLVGGVGFYLKY